MKQKYFLNDLKKIDLNISIPSIVFLKGDLGSGKTTFVKNFLQNRFSITSEIRSPTYTYYNSYKFGEILIYHFDLYRLKSYDEFFAIGGEDILDNNNGIIFIEWPEIISSSYKPDILINFYKTGNEIEREIEIIYSN